ncbi:MAG TPA: hypothetical protein VHJ20_15700 [Polyangia bacterium]|nr:hypothetical protein [Polyangia bacterium]
MPEGVGGVGGIVVTQPGVDASGGSELADGGPGVGDGPSDTAASADGPSPCPSSIDDLPQTCAPGATCEYRAAGAHPTCVRQAVCPPSGRDWVITEPPSTCGVNPSSCPPVYTSVAPQTTCALTKDGPCDYAEGRCECLSCMLGAASSVDGSWTCRRWDSGGGGCPSQSPLAGTPCTTPDLFCVYDDRCDDLAVGGDYECLDGVWRPALTTSPPGLCPSRQCPQTRGCSFSKAPAAPVSTTSGDDVVTRATAEGDATYDALVGRFLRGDVRLYAGEADVVSVRQTPIMSAPPLFTEGAALATLEVRPAHAADWAAPPATLAPDDPLSLLVIHGLAAHLYVALGQLASAPNVTWGNLLRSDDPKTGVVTSGFAASCTGCTSPFSAGSSSFIQIESAGAQGEGETTLVSRTELELLDPCAVTWRELSQVDTAVGPTEISADPGLASFIDDGTDWVSRRSGTMTTGAVTRTTCATQTTYSYDLWVDKADLAAHGVRNVQMTSTQMFCGS